MSAFNATAFEEQVINDANATAFVPIPEGDYPGAYIDDYEFKELDDPKSVLLLINWVIPDEKLAEDLNMEEVRIRQSVFIELDENGAVKFAANTNVRLGRLRAALGLNKPGKGFQFSMLRGKTATITTTQTAKEDDPETIYSNVAKVSAG